MGLTLKRVKVSDILEHEKNPRNHPNPGSEDWEILRASLADGYFDPIVINQRNGKLVSGHLRTKIFRAEGVIEADAVIVDLDENTHIARLFAANKQIGSDNAEMRKELFSFLADIPDFDIKLTGYTAAEFQSIKLGELDPSEFSGRDEAQEKSSRDSTKLKQLIGTCQAPDIEVSDGDIYQLGEHFLYCGSILKTRFESKLLELRERYQDTDKKVLFVPCPDPYVAFNDTLNVILLMIQPSDYVASHLVSNFFRLYPDEPCLKLN